MTASERDDPDLLRGTTLRIYRYLFRLGGPASIRDVQKGLGLSSPSVAEYHLKKLSDGGLVREAPEGYVVDRRVWQNMIRMKRTLIPVQLVFAVFLSAAIAAMITLFRDEPARGYVFGIVIILAALCYSLYQTGRAMQWKV